MVEGLPHLVIATRFGIGVTDDARFRARLQLFEAITLPSLRAQTDQNFLWVIFVGRDPRGWVVDRLKSLTADMGGRVEILYAAQSAIAINKITKAHFKDGPMVTGLLDDDDAISVDCYARVRTQAAAYLAQGMTACGFTYQNGYEWLMTDLIDIDKLLLDNRYIVRKSAVYAYARPFLTMSCYALSKVGECIDQIGRMHNTTGAIFKEYNQPYFVLTNDKPAWLYVRHQLANSSFQKSRECGPVNINLDGLASAFGIDADKVRTFQAQSAQLGYARKRVRSGTDKSDMMISADELAKLAG